MPDVDLITREVIQNVLASAADEMALALPHRLLDHRARLPRLLQSLCNADGEMIARPEEGGCLVIMQSRW